MARLSSKSVWVLAGEKISNPIANGSGTKHRRSWGWTGGHAIRMVVVVVFVVVCFLLGAG